MKAFEFDHQLERSLSDQLSCLVIYIMKNMCDPLQVDLHFTPATWCGRDMSRYFVLLRGIIYRLYFAMKDKTSNCHYAISFLPY